MFFWRDAVVSIEQYAIVSIQLCAVVSIRQYAVVVLWQEAVVVFWQDIVVIMRLDAIVFIWRYTIISTVWCLTASVTTLDGNTFNRTNNFSFDKVLVVSEKESRSKEYSSKVKDVSKNFYQCWKGSVAQKRTKGSQIKNMTSLNLYIESA